MKVVRVRPKEDCGEACVQRDINSALDCFYKELLSGYYSIKIKKNGCLYKESAISLAWYIHHYFREIRWNVWDYSGEITADENLLYDLLLKDYKNFVRLFPIITAKYRHLEFVDKPKHMADRRYKQLEDTNDYFKKRFC